MTPALKPNVSPDPSGTDVGVRALILYDDPDLGRQAHQVLDRLAAHLEEDLPLSVDVWKLDLLQDPELARAAAQAAVGADLLLVACHRDREIAEPVKMWFDTWIGLRPERAALVVLYEGPETFSPASRLNGAFFTAVARRGNMDLFMNPGEAFPESDLSAERLRHGAEDAFFIPPSLAPPAPGQLHWGIND